MTVLDLACEKERLVLEGTHDGFGPHRHVRRFEQTSGALRILDRIGGPSRPARLGFLLHPSVEVALDDGGAGLARGRASIAVRANVEIHCEDAVWWPDMGVERATKRLVLIAPPGAKDITTEFLWSKLDLKRGAT